MGGKGLTRQSIVYTAAKLAEEKGLDNITLHELAQALGVKTASLYNHLSGLPELNQRLAELALERLDCALRDSVVGRSGRDALMAIALAYRQFAKETPELYKAIMNLPRLADDSLNESGRAVMRIFYRVMESYPCSEEESIHFGRAFRGALHGYVSLEEAGFYSNQTDLNESFRRMVLSLIDTLPSVAPLTRIDTERSAIH